MIQEYLDEIKKIKTYQTLIQRDATLKGEFPDKKYVDKVLSNIDTRLAIFQYQNAIAEKKFDTKKFDRDLYYIYQDLKILYEVIYEIQNDKYLKLQSFVNGYLSSLEDIADEAEKSIDIEVQNSSLGKTIFYTSRPKDFSIDNSIATINLGPMTISDNGDITFFIEGTGFEQKNAVLSFDDKNFLLPYDVSHDSFSISDNSNNETCSEYEYTLSNKEIVTGAFRILTKDLNASMYNSYLVYGGKDKVLINQSSLKNKDFAVSLLADTTTISFYIIAGQYVHFEFSTVPTQKNFIGTTIDNLAGKTKFIRITMPADSSFSYETDGQIYGTKEDASVIDGELFVTTITPATDFKVYEYAASAVSVFNDCKVKIYDVATDSFQINSIAIKESSTQSKSGA